jgi:hypothetical protein
MTNIFCTDCNLHATMHADGTVACGCSLVADPDLNNAARVTAHQSHHGTGEMSDMILATRIAAGWTEQEIANNGRVTRNVAQLVEDADNRANGFGRLVAR